MYEHLAGMTEEQFLENLKDPNWRIRNLYYILDKDGQTVLFKPNEAQETFLKRIWHRNIVPKARQRGFSTVIQLLLLDACLFNENQRAAIIAQDQFTASKIMRNKIEFAYARLPDFIKSERRIKVDNTEEKIFSNGSSIQVSTSARGDTLNWLHVSEFGIICFESPLKAEKIVTGALAAAGQGITFIESTAKGRDGAYYKMVMEAKANADAGKRLSRLQYRMHFASWWDADEYEIDPEGIIITPKDDKYFDELEREIGREISLGKRAWYVATRLNDYSDDDEMMWQEYPSTVEEAFKVSTEGVILAKQMTRARAEGRITRVPWRPELPVNTFWDLGVDDDIAIWFHQSVGMMDHFIDYLECSGEPYSYVIAEMQKRGFVWGHHFLPHDGNQRRPGALVIETPQEMLEGLRLQNIHIVPRTPDLMAIGLPALKDDFVNYVIDEEKCKQGILHIDNYRKSWNKNMGVWSDTPKKNGHQHAPDAIRQKAQYRDEVRRLCGTIRPTSSNNGSRRRARDPMTL
ncbi:hypothetical protein GGQ73_003031 [Rhizobium skierniewicense]|uniref:Terminase n=1 Tax=Rhizobium skierniewicense TaxID=984260 RepID=A0A7W6C798_9HYPH|nr:hypothetical protein [Rhizobium skierniewicense]MBB3947067.1 hypothetical protein [Rhizobium skierniewicense]